MHSETTYALDQSTADVSHTSGSEVVRQAALEGGLGEGVGLPLNADYFNIASFLADQTVTAPMQVLFWLWLCMVVILMCCW